MAENYGLPYTGSKSRIAHEVVAEKQKMTYMSSVKPFNVTERLYTVKK